MRFIEKEALDISVVLPCYNEEKTVGECVYQALEYFQKAGLRGEVVVVDNGSTDRSGRVARTKGARVIYESRFGYGRALRTGLQCTRGRVIIMADADLTYDITDLDRFYEPLSRGQADVMIGNRFRGGIEAGAMPPLHRLGVPLLTLLGNIRFGVRVGDFHCGIRGVTRKALKFMTFGTTGMEFATELIAEASRKGCVLGQTPAVLRRAPEGRSSKLHTFRDGFRHFAYIVGG